MSLSQKTKRKRHWLRPPSTGSGPDGRVACSASFLPADSRVYVFGGFDGRFFLNDLYSLNLDDPSSAVWTKQEANGVAPSARGGHSTCASGLELILFGGGDGHSYLNDLHVLDTETLEWSQAFVAGTTPAARSRHTATLVGHRMFVFGGGDDVRLFDDVYVLNLKSRTWSRPPVAGNPPVARWGHTAVAMGSSIYVVGGHDGSNMRNDVHVLNTETMEWSLVSKSRRRTGMPAGRAGHSSAVISETAFLVFGGGDGGNVLNDAWLFDIESSAWVKPAITGTPPPARCAHTNTVVADGKLLVFGGGDGSRNFKDLYYLDAPRVAANYAQSKRVRAKAQRDKARSKGKARLVVVDAVADDEDSQAGAGSGGHASEAATTATSTATGGSSAAPTTAGSSNSNGNGNDNGKSSKANKNKKNTNNKKKKRGKRDTLTEIPEDIPSWLHLIGCNKYIPAFEGVSFARLFTMADDDLKALGVTAGGARKRILQRAQRLKRAMAEASAAANKQTSDGSGGDLPPSPPGPRSPRAKRRLSRGTDSSANPPQETTPAPLRRDQQQRKRDVSSRKRSRTLETTATAAGGDEATATSTTTVVDKNGTVHHHHHHYNYVAPPAPASPVGLADPASVKAQLTAMGEFTAAATNLTGAVDRLTAAVGLLLGEMQVQRQERHRDAPADVARETGSVAAGGGGDQCLEDKVEATVDALSTASTLLSGVAAAGQRSLDA